MPTLTSTPTSTTREIKQGIIERFGGSVSYVPLETVAKIAPIYKKNALEALLEMRDALSRRERERLRLAAHTMRGSSGNIGLLRLAFLCGEVERLAQEDAFAAAALELRRAAAEFRQAQTVLDELAANAQPSDFFKDV